MAPAIPADELPSKSSRGLDLLAEIVQNRLGNTQLDVIFPSWKPTMWGITK